MRHLAFALLLAACGSPTVIDGKQYSKACTTAADCVPVFFGDMCAVCGCPNAAIASSAKLTYDADRNGARAWCGPQPAVACGPCQESTVACTSGSCELVVQQ